jgi:uncharacterized linocin/CFP29 family protein
MNRRHRNLAPLTDTAWAIIDREARRTLASMLAARHLVAFDGPLGWDAAGIATGRQQPVHSPVDGVTAAARRIRPLVELRIDCTLQRQEMDLVEQGGADPDLTPLLDGARTIARAEDTLVFEGDTSVGIDGIVTASPHTAIVMEDDFADFPRWVARGVATLRDAGVDGPYGVALGARCYTAVAETTEHGGYPVVEHLRLVTGGPVVWAPAIDGAVVLSLRGGDFELHCGDDLGIGYVRHDDSTVTLAIDESVTFTNHSPEAAIALRHG